MLARRRRPRRATPGGCHKSSHVLGPLRILHVDMDAFFASVEQLDNPQLRGKPVLVGYDGPRGVVAAASYESRKFGCRSAMPTAVAKRLCPQAIIVPVRFGRYGEVSRQVFAIFESYTPLVQPLSVDEAFLDVAGSVRLFGSPESIAQQIKDRIRATTGLTGSVGVAPNKFLAKLASDMNKPDGLTVISEDNVDTILPPLPVEKIWGIGPKTTRRLNDIGVRTIGDLRRLSSDLLKLRLGDDAEHYRKLAFGIDDRVVSPDRDAKSIGQEQTFDQNLTDPEAVRSVILGQAEQVGARVRRNGVVARSVTVKIRYGDFETITRRTTLADAADSTAALWTAAKTLFDAWASSDFRPVRLIGVTAGQLSPAENHASLFTDPAREKEKRLDSVVDQINAKFGKRAVHRAPSAGRRRDGK
jgi:DNA polymerase-4